MFSALGVRLAMTTAHNPKADGLAERQIGTLEEGLRLYAAFGQIQNKDGLRLDWVNSLFMLEYAYNSAVHSTTKKTPFELDIGRIPSSSLDAVSKRLGLPGSVDRSSEKYLQYLSELQNILREL